MANAEAEMISVESGRRRFLSGSAYFAASFALPTSIPAASMAAEASTSADFIDTEKSLLTFFSAKGYRTTATKPLITNKPDFNGGLRYDETGTVDLPAQMIVQPCARLSDISEKNRSDILPLFHIFRCNARAGQTTDDLFTLCLAYLTGPLRLDPARLAIVSIPPFEYLKTTVLGANIEWERQVHLRNPDAAWKSGDGSGIFRHPGPGYVPAIPTAGLYYRLGNSGDPPKTHPLPAAWTEVGEFVITENGNAFFGLGVERLQLASTGSIPSWGEQLPTLMRRVRRETGDGAMPPGAKTFAAS